MRVKLIEAGRAVFFIFFLAVVAFALWSAREFSPIVKKIHLAENFQAEMFKQIFSSFDNKPWEDGFGILEKEIFPVYRFKNSSKFLEDSELELIGYALTIEGMPLGRKWKALMGISPIGDVLGIKMIEMNEPMGFKQIFYDERNFLDFYRENKLADLKKMETPFIRGAYLLSKSLDDEIRRNLSFFEENKTIFEKRHPRQKNIKQIKKIQKEQNGEVVVHDSFS
jgi:hypothetical protein